MRFLCALVLVWLLPQTALAEVSAILIGVSDYEDGTGITDLNGPKNDVVLLRDVLGRRGISDVTVIADGVEGALDPTRDTIMGTLAAKAKEAAEGDFVFIHFSGHGTQQKDLNGDEADGLDEVFLPADTAPADPGTGLIKNAIVDDEIGAMVDLFRAKGANVWLVLDSCHAGSGLRSAGADFTTRFVDPRVLGVDDVPVLGPRETQSELDLPNSSGGVIAFYAAQSSELAREIKLPDGEFYGLFSSRLAAQLDGATGHSFRQLFQATMRDMNDSSVPGAARMQTPLWEGELIDAAVFGDETTTNLRRFEVRDEQILAGLVHGLSDGTLIGLVENASDGADEIIGYAQMEITEAASAFLRPVGELCEPSLEAPCAIEGELPAEAKFGQVVARPIDLTIAFSVPIDFETGEALDENHPAFLALSKGISNATEAVELTRENFDIDVAWDGTSLWFGPRATLQDQLIGRSFDLGSGAIEPTISLIAKGEIMVRLLTSLAGSGSILNPNPITLNATVSPVSTSELLPSDANVDPIRECRRAIGRADPEMSVPLSEAMEFKQCDGVSFRVQGKVAGARDVNRVHVDAQFCVHNDYARVVDATAAVGLGQDMTICSNCPGNVYSAGDERLFIVVSEAAPNSPALNLSGRIENCGTGSGSTRSADSGAADAFLDSLGDGRATRGNFGGTAISNIWVDAFRWTVLPKEIALAGR